ncbi:heterokaryon incompatibility protein-domain-containing protein, partial [Calycina marina]
MRLIDVRKLEVKEFLNEDHVPPYAILSHTWGADECTLQAMKDADIGARAGYPKIKRCCEQAKEDGLDWAWVDTCCIDKTSTTELSEAINSMFRWYRMAKVCYAYLSDVVKIEDMPHSRWFMRGWTLQELIAPRNIVFYCESWIELGTKETLQKDISYITDIEQSVLLSGLIDKVSIARRMSWASKRETTRLEDRAYSLLRIFDVNMPLLYGEGKRAFTRLQEEIMKHSEDHSLFAW